MRVNEKSKFTLKVGDTFTLKPSKISAYKRDFFEYKVIKIAAGEVRVKVIGSSGGPDVGELERHLQKSFWKCWNFVDFIINVKKSEFEKHKQRMLNAT